MKRDSGFTLLEFALVITISGILMVAAIRAYLVWDQDSKYYAMVDKLKTIKQTLADFNEGKKRYPCPADPSLPITDPNAGIEATTVVAGVTYCWATTQAGNLAAPTVAGTPVCNAAGQPFPNSKAGSICRILGARDTLADADTNNDIAEIGGLPFRSMKAATTKQDMTELTMADALDPWSYQFTYAVTENVLVLNNLSQGQWGALDVRSETTTTAANSGVDLVLPPQSANYVVVGHGADHNGAYTTAGVIAVPCGAVPTGPGVPANSAVDNFNCNKGNIFVDGLLSNAAGPSHNDDAIIYATGYISRLWDYTAQGSNDIYNLNTGGVAIGANAVSQASIKMQVTGADLRLTPTTSDASNSWTTSMDAPLICQSFAGGNCFNPALFGGYDGWNPANPNNPYKDGTGTVIGPGTVNNYTVVNAQPSGNSCDAIAGAPPSAGQVRVVKSLAPNGKVTCASIGIPVLPTSHSCQNAGKYAFGFNGTQIRCCNVDGVTGCSWQ